MDRIIGISKNGVKKVGRFAVDIEVANYRDILLHQEKALPADRVRRLVISGVVDPGAASLVLPEGVATQLGLPKARKVKVKYAEGRRGTRDLVEAAYVTIQGRSGDFRAVLEKNRSTALIGAIVLEDLDFLIDPRNGKLVPRDPNFLLMELE